MMTKARGTAEPLETIGPAGQHQVGTTKIGQALIGRRAPGIGKPMMWQGDKKGSRRPTLTPSEKHVELCRMR